MRADLSTHPGQNSVNRQGMGCGLLESMFSLGGSGLSSLMYAPMSTCLWRLTQPSVTALAGGLLALIYGCLKIF